MSDTKDTLGQAGNAAREHGTAVAGSVGEQAGSVRDEATDKARDLVRQSGDQIRERADSQTKEAASTLSELSSELRSMADGADNPDGTMVRLAQEGSKQLGSLSERLESGGIDGAMDDLRRFGRRRPGVFIGACFAAGVVLGRTMRNADTSGLTDAARSGAQPDESEPTTGTELASGSTEDQSALPSGSRDVSSGVTGRPKTAEPGVASPGGGTASSTLPGLTSTAPVTGTPPRSSASEPGS